MTFEESLKDVSIRERQLEAHILRSPEYLRQVDQNLKRQVSVLYLAIALLILFQGLFTFRTYDELPVSATFLMGVTSVLAIVNCVIMINTKKWLRRVNQDWLNPQEKTAFDTLRTQRIEILTRGPRSRDASEQADLN